MTQIHFSWLVILTVCRGIYEGDECGNVDSQFQVRVISSESSVERYYGLMVKKDKDVIHGMLMTDTDSTEQYTSDCHNVDNGVCETMKVRYSPSVTVR